jgi:hypothetical protein
MGDEVPSSAAPQTEGAPEQRIGVPQTDFKELFSQHWLHARHVANERLAFTSIYLLFLATGLVYVFGPGRVAFAPKMVVLFILLLFSAIGFHVMVRISVTFWYHYIELKRLTPLLFPGEALDYETRQAEVEQEIKNSEPQLWFLNGLYLTLSKKGGLPLPMTLLFPSIFLLGAATLALLVAAVFLGII